MLEPFLHQTRKIFLFGAGHVGREIVKVMDALSVQIIWVDSRAQEFPQTMAGNVQKRVVENPVSVIDEMCDDDAIIILTHSHDLDFDLTKSALSHGKFSYLGLIGSDTKRARFERRLTDGGISRAELSRLICPIGIPAITGKHPREIAIAVAAELLSLGISAPARAKVAA